ncbi:MAG: endonuclease/exonuclease/phosphatase family protein [Chloroflexota bacterium]|nr:endonuclease/exonuclease/phosphatase family protein [Chloroflexota bacterium]
MFPTALRARISAAMPLALVLAVGSLPMAPLPADAARPPEAVRFATFNASLNRNGSGQALADLSSPGNAQASAVAEITQRTRPEVLLINEFDFEPDHALATAFQDNYLSVPQAGDVAGIRYPHVYVAPSNTGIPSGMDFSNDGSVGGPNDAFGFGFFPGQFGMAVFSQHPILTDEVRTFQKFLWKDMPGALLPDDPATEAPADWYSPAELGVFRLSSKSHWDVPISVGGTTVHFLVSHPTPPVFDDPPAFPAGVDFNGRRNFDEIRLWADYVTPGAGGYIYDDEGAFGGLRPGSKFVIAGDQNSDPLDGDSIPGSIQQLLDSPRINTTVTPSSVGGTGWSEEQAALNGFHDGDPAFDTADFCDTPAFPPCSGPGNLRADYVLPSRDLKITDAAVFWPEPGHPLVYLTGTGFPVPSSDHRLVWVDVRVPGSSRGG